MAKLNNKVYDDWEEYITDKFPAVAFNISTEKTESSKIIRISSKSKSKTLILFDFPTSDLCRTCFYHPDSPFLNADNDKERQRALMYSDYELNDENLQNTNEGLNIPLYFGWSEKAFYYKGKLLRSELLYFDGVNWQTISIEQNLGWYTRAGCLITLLTWPVLLIEYKLVKHRLKNDKHVKITQADIPPIIPNSITR
ncbi:MAG: hypothetical protein ABI480_07245 [Chitinophagaceae bacterium]